MKYTSILRILLFFVAIGFGFLVEYVDVFFENEKLCRVLYAFIAIVVTVIMENIIRRNEFKDRVVEFVKLLKKIRIGYKLDPPVIQDVMQATTEQLSIALEQKGFLYAKNWKRHEPKEVPCSTCGSLHKTDDHLRCTKCRIAKSYWEKIEKE